MLPLDEAPFEIDANARSIKVPETFNKCAGVQGDNLCEIITFTVDRYFDYVDLETTAIAIQWKSVNREGIHLVDRNLRDIISRPGKIRFGWPLSSSVTETPGDVVFSIRFFITPENGGPVKYILNTLPAKINIKQTLQITDPNAVEETNISNLFKDFVENSQFGSGESALSPSFGYPGLDLNPFGALNNDNTLTLTAQAVSGDKGFITYDWYFRSSDAKENDLDLLIVDTEEEPNPNYGIETFYDKIVWEKVDEEGNPIKERVPGEKYFTYDPITGIGTPYNPDFTQPDNLPELYERFSRLTIKNTDAEITGKYYVKAHNTVSTNTSSANSSVCIVPAPGDVTVTTPLPDHVFMEDKKPLTFAIANENSQLSNYTYVWKKNGNPIADNEFSGVNVLSTAFEPTEVGYYQVNYTVDLNRTTKTDSSTICKVTYKPQAPVVEKLLQIDEDGNEINILDLDADDELPVYGKRESVHLKIVTNLDDVAANEFLTEGLTYQWKINLPDSGGYVDIADTKGLVEFNEDIPNELIVYVPPVEYERYGLSCVITNTIQKKAASVNIEEKYRPFIISWTDDEIPEVEKVPSEEV